MYGLSDFQVYYLGFLYTQNWQLVLHLQTCTWYKMLNYIEYAVWYVYYEQHQYKTCTWQQDAEFWWEMGNRCLYTWTNSSHNKVHLQHNYKHLNNISINNLRTTQPMRCIHCMYFHNESCTYFTKYNIHIMFMNDDHQFTSISNTHTFVHTNKMMTIVAQGQKT